MLSLKNTFSSEMRKVEASFKKSDSGVSDVYNPKWKFYRHLFFLKDNFTLSPLVVEILTMWDLRQ